jgi:hypothetical protein
VSGGVTLAGAAETSTSALYTATVSGGIQFSGAATLARSYVPLVSGGVTFSGAATTSLVPAGAAVEYPYTASGGIEFGGAATVETVSGFMPAPAPRYTGGGGVVAPGLSWEPKKYTYRGGVRLGWTGKADTRKTPAYTGSGGIGLTGTAEYLLIRRTKFEYFGEVKARVRMDAKTAYQRSLAAIAEEELLALWM